MSACDGDNRVTGVFTTEDQHGILLTMNTSGPDTLVYDKDYVYSITETSHDSAWVLVSFISTVDAQDNPGRVEEMREVYYIPCGKKATA